MITSRPLWIWPARLLGTLLISVLLGATLVPSAAAAPASNQQATQSVEQVVLASGIDKCEAAEAKWWSKVLYWTIKGFNVLWPGGGRTAARKSPGPDQQSGKKQPSVWLPFSC
jgi:hypothetical protein